MGLMLLQRHGQCDVDRTRIAAPSFRCRQEERGGEDGLERRCPPRGLARAAAAMATPDLAARGLAEVVTGRGNCSYTSRHGRLAQY